MSQVPETAPRKRKPRWYMSRWFIGVAAFVLGLLLGSGGADETAPAAAEDAAASTVTVTATPVPSDPTATVTVTETPTEEASPESTATAPAPEDDDDGAGQSSKPQRRGRLYPVLEVVDGDTVKVAYQGGVSVRVIGIDTPETVHPSQPDECWGPAASAAAKKMLSGKRVRLVFDASQGRTDSFGRTLAYLEAPGLGDFGLAMLKRGHAAEYTYDTAYQRQAQYRRAASAAESAGKAMWGHCGGPDVPLQTAEPTPTPQPPAPEPEQPPAGSCAVGYDPCVPPYPPDVDCGDVDGPIRVTGEDPHGLDGEGDGIACES